MYICIYTDIYTYIHVCIYIYTVYTVIIKTETARFLLAS